MGVGMGGALEAASLHPCPSLEECMWSDWSSWTRCSCKVPVQQRYRHQGPAPGQTVGGAPCTRLDGHFRPCTIGNCSGKAQGSGKVKELNGGGGRYPHIDPPPTRPQCKCPGFALTLALGTQLLLSVLPTSYTLHNRLTVVSHLTAAGPTVSILS